MIWCFFGTIPTTASAVGVRGGGEDGAVCFVPAAQGYAIKPGMAVRFTPAGGSDTISGQVEQVDQPVISADAAAEQVSCGSRRICPETGSVRFLCG